MIPPLWQAVSAIVLCPLQDHHVFKKKGYKDCPTKGRCMNCMPTGDDVDDYKCWGIKRPIMYKVRVPSGAFGQLLGCDLVLPCWFVVLARYRFLALTGMC